MSASRGEIPGATSTEAEVAIPSRHIHTHTLPTDTHKCMATTQIFYKDTQITPMIPKGINSCQGFVPPKVMLENARFLREQPAA